MQSDKALDPTDIKLSFKSEFLVYLVLFMHKESI